MRILVRTSKWAVWARRFGVLALPLGLFAVLMHREHLLQSAQFEIVAAVALGLAALAVLMALVAFARLWITGDRGWWRATVAFLFGVVCLAPAAYLAYEFKRQPASPDMTTDFANPPQLVSFVEAHFTAPDERARLEAAFPNARTRTYPITAPQMYDTIAGMVDDRGWEVRATSEPQGPLDTGQINAIATSLLGFREEVVIRVAGSADGSTIAMRSTSLAAFPDMGGNGRRIESFLLDLDNAVTKMLRGVPAPSGDDG